ncbi:MAG TPA: filamentous hemagglutinin N-terminal domain-containing protein [Geminicoccaceae bacterium]|nr:filamentous hemagglutinin N-terminal domain-containing protein [Geminicoccaceae bacterium]
MFHSFERFSLATGERATFTGPDQIRNVISRVTGGARSDIDGTLRSTIPGADLYFLNPAGVVFGPNASLDLQGSFHVSTADELRFADGARFSATDPAASSFTVAAPEAFGFLGGRPGNIVVDRSTLDVPAGESLSIVGGGVTIAGDNTGGERARIRAEAGAVTILASDGAGAARIADGRLTGTRSDVTLANRALIDVSGEGGGTVRIAGAQIAVGDGSEVIARNIGSADAAGGVSVAADLLRMRAGLIRTAALGAGDAGAVTITAGSIEISSFGEISSDTFSHGDAGPVAVTADRIELRDGGSIRSSTAGPGNAGAVQVAAERIVLAGGNGDARISSFAGVQPDGVPSSGNAGAVRIEAGDLTVRDGGLIESSTFGFGKAGTVRVDARRIVIDGGDQGIAAIESEASGTFLGDAGKVRVEADELLLRAGGMISSAARNQGGKAGAVRVVAERIVIDGGGKPVVFITGITSASAFFLAGAAGLVRIETGELLLRDGGVISTETTSGAAGGRLRITASEAITIAGPSSILASSDTLQPGASPAGRIRITAPTIRLTDGGTIQSVGLRDAAAGGIVLEAADSLRLSDGAIAASTERADAGDIRIVAGRLIELQRSAITTSAAGGRGGGGSIIIDPRFVVLNDSAIVATARRGAGGRIEIAAENLVRSPDSVISAASGVPTLSGTVAISAPEVDLAGGLVILDPALLDAASQLRERCGARRDIGTSSFTGVGRGGLPASPDAPLSAVARTGLVAGTDGARAPAASLDRPAPAAAPCLGAPD